MIHIFFDENIFGEQDVVSGEIVEMNHSFSEPNGYELSIRMHAVNLLKHMEQQNKRRKLIKQILAMEKIEQNI